MREARSDPSGAFTSSDPVPSADLRAPIARTLILTKMILCYELYKPLFQAEKGLRRSPVTSAPKSVCGADAI